ncbi:MAG: biopolymer transporter ExbD [Acidobacteria bacterium]|nr:biopolymer transporter ExbD [Acidobacteriota bacterium]
MGMSAGGGGGANANINVTPLIDVLLVLLIIFMVIQPNVVRGLDTLVPQPPKENQKDMKPDDRTIVVQIALSGGQPVYMINNTPFAKQDIEPKLLSIFETRNDKVMFVKGDKDLDFGRVVEVIDFGHQAGVDNIGIITPRVEQGQ